MTHLLDTNVCIAHLRGDPVVAARLGRMPDGSPAICSVVKAELLTGAHKSRDPVTALRETETFINGLPSAPFDDTAADVYARVRAELERRGQKIGPYDLMIAAIAIANGLTLVTRNVGEFSRVAGLRIEDWRAPSP